MSERRWRTSLVIAVLLLVAVALTGCPKKPETGLGGAAATAGSTGVGGGTSGTGDPPRSHGGCAARGCGCRGAGPVRRGTAAGGGGGGAHEDT